MKEIYLLKSCNEWKEHSSAKIVMSAQDKHTLHVAMTGEILLGNMEYRGLCNEAGAMQFAEDVRNNIDVEDNLKYGYVETVECLSKSDTSELRKMYDEAADIFQNEDDDELEE